MHHSSSEFAHTFNFIFTLKYYLNTKYNREKEKVQILFKRYMSKKEGIGSINLSIAGNCRMCIVEMGKMNKPIVACAVSAGTSLFNQKRLLTTGPNDIEVFDRLNINIKSVLDSSGNNSYIRGCINTVSALNSDLKLILTDNSSNFKEKQEKLEKLSQQNQTFDLELKYNVPRILSELIEKLDSILLDQENLQNNDISPYLPSVLAVELGEHYKLRKSYKTQDLIRTIGILKDILKVFKYMENSFGLFLVYNLVSMLRADFNSKKLKKQVKESNSIHRRLSLSTNESLNTDTEVTLNLKRVDVTEKFGQKLIESFTYLKNACLYDIKKIKIKGLSDLNSEEQFATICETLETSDPEKLELFKMLSDKCYDTDLESGQIIKLGIHCVFILEAMNILVDDGLSRDKRKTLSKIKIDKRYADEILSIPSKPKNLPMIIRPNFWKKNQKTEEGNLNYGGYLFNKVFNYPAILNRHKKGITRITQEDLKDINFLQSSYYEINEQFFEYVETNFKDVLSKYLRKIPNPEFLIRNFNDKNTNSIEIQSINELLSGDQELSALTKNVQTQGKCKALLKEISKRQDYLVQKYQDIANIFFGLMHAYTVARHYKGYEFYFTVFMDGRGRIYYKSVGAAFGLQTGDFSKSLIDLVGNSYYSQRNMPNKAHYSLSNRAYLDYTLSLTPQKEPFQLTRVEKQNLPTTISNDASCSGTSILAGLVGLRRGLLLTNVLVETKDNCRKKQSIYTYFLETMIVKFPENVHSLYSQEQILKKAKKLKMTENDFISAIEHGLSIIKDELLQREHAKQFVMRKNYSETNKGRMNYIYDNIFLPALYLSRQNSGAIDNYNGFLFKKIYTSFCYYLAKWIDSLYYEKFPEIAGFCALLAKHFETKNPITLSCPNNSDFQYQQLLYKTVKIPRASLQKSRKSDLSINLETNEPDYQKIERSLVANFIHYLDSRLNFLVTNKCRLEEIPLWVNHDCFYVCPTKKNRLLDHYFTSFRELLLEDNVIEHFLNANNIKANDSLKKLLKISSANRKIILKELDNGNLKMSRFILSS